VYEAELSKTNPTSIAASGDSNSKKKEDSYFYEFIAHASLDFLDERLASKSQQNLFYSNIDRFNEWLISAFVTPSHLRFIVLHDQRNEENIKAFCQEVHEVYVKVSKFYSIPIQFYSKILINFFVVSLKKVSFKSVQ
jgi:hypothetical protein